MKARPGWTSNGIYGLAGHGSKGRDWPGAKRWLVQGLILVCRRWSGCSGEELGVRGGEDSVTGGEGTAHWNWNSGPRPNSRQATTR